MAELNRCSAEAGVELLIYLDSNTCSLLLGALNSDNYFRSKREESERETNELSIDFGKIDRRQQK